MPKPEPGRDPGMVRRTETLNIVFALSSVVLLLIFSLTIWVDYDREWKPYQKAFNVLDITLTEKQRQQVLDKIGTAREKALDEEVRQGDEEVRKNARSLAEAQTRVDKAKGDVYRLDQNFRFTKANIDVDRYEYDEAFHLKSAEVPPKKKKLEDDIAVWDDFRRQKEAAEARLAEIQAEVNGLEKIKLDAEAKQKALYGDRDRLDDKIRKASPGFVSFVRNLPVLDLANPSLRINQIMPTSLVEDVNFTTTPRVDRCTTCHLGIDKKGHEKDPQPFTTHPNMDFYLRNSHPIEKVGCTVCHQGRGRATSFQNAAHVPSTKEQETNWGKYIHKSAYKELPSWDFQMTARGHTESQCAKCHQGVVEVPGAERLNTGIFLVERYGCFGCHKIKGWEGLRKIGPDLTKVASKTNEEWIIRWIKRPHDFRQTRMPQVWDVRVNETPEQKARNDAEANAAAAYILEKSEKVRYPEPPKGDLKAGLSLFQKVGCLACHRVGDDRRGIVPATFADGQEATIDSTAFRTHGPNLDGTGSKVNAGWLYAWLRDPKGYWHETKMPNLRLTEAEAANLTAYLMSLKNDGFMAKPRPTMDAKVRDTIVKEALLAQLTEAQTTSRLAGMDDHARTLFLGEKTIARYGCFGCHTISGFEKASPIGVELTEEGSKLEERLDFGFEEETIPHTLPAWIHRKLMEPRVFDRDKNKRPEDLLRMPKFFFTDEEANELVTAVLSFTKEQISLSAQKQLSPDDKAIQEGTRLVRNLNCRACHVLGDKGGTIRAVIESELVTSGVDSDTARIQTVALSPPVLYEPVSKIGEGARVQTAWIHRFLNDPSNKVRPWLEIRMPTFEFTEAEINTLTRYFTALDKVPFPFEPKTVLTAAQVSVGHDLFVKWQCAKCHVVAGKLPNQDPVNMAPDLANVPTRLRADWIAHWLKDPGKIQPGTRMPQDFPETASENAYPEILGGDQTKQIEAVRAYLLSLGGSAKPSAD
jgi:mono/diheme cytochrome c family protein